MSYIKYLLSEISITSLLNKKYTFELFDDDGIEKYSIDFKVDDRYFMWRAYKELVTNPFEDIMDKDINSYIIEFLDENEELGITKKGSAFEIIGTAFEITKQFFQKIKPEFFHIVAMEKSRISLYDKILNKMQNDFKDYEMISEITNMGTKIYYFKRK